MMMDPMRKKARIKSKEIYGKRLFDNLFKSLELCFGVYCPILCPIEEFELELLLGRLLFVSFVRCFHWPCHLSVLKEQRQDLLPYHPECSPSTWSSTE